MKNIPVQVKTKMTNDKENQRGSPFLKALFFLDFTHELWKMPFSEDEFLLGSLYYSIIMNFFIAFSLLFSLSLNANGGDQLESLPAAKSPRYSVACFSPLPNGEDTRELYGLNPGWKFFKGDAQNAEQAGFDDSGWQSVNLPHGLEVLPEEASGCSNYQGPAWYRKTVIIPETMKGKRLVIYFEGVMGKSSVWVDGKALKKHEGGYLPFMVDISDKVEFGKPTVVAVKTDNSDDPSFPPGTPQKTLDFTYFGGIYRDVYLIGTDKVHITDANEADTVAGGGVFFRTDAVNSQGEAKTFAKIQIANDTNKEQKLSIHGALTYPGDLVPVTKSQSLVLAPGARGEVELPFVLEKARLWSPEDPHLYNLAINVYQDDAKGKSSSLLDACNMKVGVRTVSLSVKGFELNGKPYGRKLMGANRHQDFATLGNAVPNNLQWRDAVKLRDAGMKVIRCAHYPMDPAFMDACDRLGMFVIVTTPGWQFWGTGNFGEKVEKDVRQMVRRDRNRPSILMWEPILNETHFGADFAKRMREVVREEYPYSGCYVACDAQSKGSESYDVLYSHPSSEFDKMGKPFFTREYGDFVDSWSAHNSPARVSRQWGETPMLIQAKHHLNPSYKTPSSVSDHEGTPDYHFGACLWHPFDHQRGYHPDPFYGGIFDAYRQPKVSFYAHKSQRSPKGEGKHIPGKGPFIWIANECTPFSPENVTVFTNCDLVRLSVNGETALEKKPDKGRGNLKHPPIVFEKAWNYVDNKNLTRNGEDVKLIAEGLIDGKVVARHEVSPARRAEQVRLSLDDPDFIPEANGSDIVQIIASVTDKNGNVKRLNNEQILFEVEGPASIVGDARSGANPKSVEWGNAPLLLRTGITPGKVSVKASVLYPGLHKPTEGKLEFSILPSSRPLLMGQGGEQTAAFDPASSKEYKEQVVESAKEEDLKKEVDRLNKELNDLRLREVSRQQADFE